MSCHPPPSPSRGALGDGELWRYKCLAPGVSEAALAQRALSAFDEQLALPLLLVRASELEHNLALMAQRAARTGALLAPHAKTPMMPYVFERQLAAGAWGLTVATPAQARIVWEFGVRRILIANQVLEPGALRWMADELARDPTVELFCLVDSVDGVRQMQVVLAAAPRPVSVLVELGSAGGRAGARDTDTARAVAEAVAASSGLALAGVSGWDGLWSRRPGSAADRVTAVDTFVEHLVEACTVLEHHGLVARERTVLSVGTTGFYDRALKHAGAGDTRDVVLRCGGYVTGDAMYEGIAPSDRAGAAPFLPALELWGRVLSTPEPGLAIIGFGRRDTSVDTGLPVAFAVRRDGVQRPSRGEEIVGLHDHHATVTTPASSPLRVGDLLGARVVHACTTFDRWSLIPVVDDADRVIELARTFFG